MKILSDSCCTLLVLLDLLTVAIFHYGKQMNILKWYIHGGYGLIVTLPVVHNVGHIKIYIQRMLSYICIWKNTFIVPLITRINNRMSYLLVIIVTSLACKVCLALSLKHLCLSSIGFFHYNHI